MALNWPDSPVANQQFPDPGIPGVPTWRWDGEKWVPARGGISDAPSDGLLYGRSNGAWAQITQETIEPESLYQVWTFFTPGAHTFTTLANSTISTLWRFHVQGGGGGGGGIHGTGTWPGQGGGGGEYQEFTLSDIPPDTAFELFVGAGGTAGPPIAGAPGFGGPGGNSFVRCTPLSMNVESLGGRGGGSSSGTTYDGLGGIGGAVTAGLTTLRLILDIGGADAAPPVSVNDPSHGADSFYGFGAPAVNTANYGTATIPKGYGGGGRGSYNNNVSGTAGTGGIIIIERARG